MDSQNSFLIREAIIFTGEEFLENSVAVVQNGRIVSVQSEQDLGSLSNDIKVISKPGHTLIPGLIDAHVHGLEGNVQCLEQSLRFGVTTVCDMHNDKRSLTKLIELAKDPGEKSKYADFKCAGAGATIEDGWPAAVMRLEYKDKPEIANAILASLPKLKDGSDAESFVKAQITDHGASYIKLMHELGDTIDMDLPRPPLELTKSIVQAAHSNGLIAVGHAFSHAGATDLLQGGVDGLTHVFFDTPPSDDWLALMKRNKAHCNPTLGLAASQAGEGANIQKRFTQTPFAQQMLFDKTPRQDLGLSAKNSKASYSNAVQNAKAMYKAGIPLIVGSDCAGKHLGTAYGLGVHIEIHLMSQLLGMKPTEVLRAATALTADRFGFKDRGQIQPGKKADLVLLEGDPREFLQDKNTLCLPVKMVWRDGIACSVYSI